MVHSPRTKHLQAEHQAVIHEMLALKTKTKDALTKIKHIDAFWSIIDFNLSSFAVEM